MRTVQLHYTSCRRGLSGSAGLQTRSMTPGTREDQRHEFERRLNYERPRDSNPDPTDDELFDFPRAFRYAPLGPDRWLVTRVSYAGKDYSGRRGNVFGHGLYTEGGAPSLFPIDLYEWEGWVGRLPPEEDTRDDPAALEAVDLADIPPAVSFTWPELAAFLTADPVRAKLLPRMIAAVFAARAHSRPLVIRADAFDASFWVACLHKAFPLQVAAGLGFSTYQFHERGCTDINVTTGETEFRFDETGRRRFYLFDPAGQSSEVPADWDDYAQPMARWLAHAPEDAEAFHVFAEHFVGIGLDIGPLAALTRLFLIAEGAPPSDVRPLAELARTHGRPGSERALAAHLDGGVGFLVTACQWEAAMELVTVQSELAGRSDRASQDACVRRFLSLYAATVGLPALRARLAETRRLVEAGLGQARGRLSECMLDDTWLGRLVDRIDARSAEAVLSDVLDAARSLRRRALSIAAVPSLLRAAQDAAPGEASCTRLLRAFAAEDQTEAACALADSAAPGELGKALAARTLDAAVLGALVAHGHAAVAEAALSASIVRAHDPFAAWHEIASRVLPGLSVGRGWIEDMIAGLPPVTAVRIAVDLLNRGLQEGLPDNAARVLVRTANAGLAPPEPPRADPAAERRGEAAGAPTRAAPAELVPGRRAELCVQITLLAARVGEPLRPDWPMLHSLTELSRGEAALTAEDLASLPGALEGATSTQVRGFLADFLGPALGHVRTADGHGRLVEALWGSQRTSEVGDAVESWIRAASQGPWTPGRQNALIWWLQGTGAGAGYGGYGEARGPLGGGGYHREGEARGARPVERIGTSPRAEATRGEPRPPETGRRDPAWWPVETPSAARQRPRMLGAWTEALAAREDFPEVAARLDRAGISGWHELRAEVEKKRNGFLGRIFGRKP